MIIKQWHAATTTTGTVTHSCISCLLISRRLSRLRVASRYSVRTSSYFKAIYENIIMCVMNAFMWPKVGVATRWTLLSEFLNPPLIHPEQTQPSWCTTPAKWIVHDWPDVLYSELCPPPPPTYLFSELLCGLCGQEPEAIQRQCHGEFFFVL